jgi:RNA polymerase sigma-70 factor (ECF subfamily)
MSEGKRVVTGEAILSRLGTIERELVESRNDALGALVREHSRLVYRVAYAVVRSHHDAEDVTQETFLRVLRYSSKLAEVKEPKTWLARIAWRVAVDRSKRRGQTREVALEEPAAEAVSPDTPADETVHGVELGAAVDRLIAALPAKLREPLILSAIEEMSPREIAGTLGISEAAVRSRVFRARQILREKLGERVGRK